MYYVYKDTKAGTLLFVGIEQTVYGIYWKVFKDTPTPQSSWIEDEAPFKVAIQQIDEYLEGTRETLDFPYELKGTEFQKNVWRELLTIPFGKSSTYQDIAAAIHNPKAVRAVGTAVGHNPLSIIVPCHRVLGVTGKLCGYAGGLDAKRVLLDREHIAYSNN